MNTTVRALKNDVLNLFVANSPKHRLATFSAQVVSPALASNSAHRLGKEDAHGRVGIINSHHFDLSRSFRHRPNPVMVRGCSRSPTFALVSHA